MSIMECFISKEDVTVSIGENNISIDIECPQCNQDYYARIFAEDFIEDTSRNESKSMDEKFGDDCDAQQRMAEAKKLK